MKDYIVDLTDGTRLPVNANKDALTKFEQLLDEYFQDQLPIQNGLPSVKYFADKVYLSPNYFGDMVKKETGKTDRSGKDGSCGRIRVRHPAEQRKNGDV